MDNSQFKPRRRWPLILGGFVAVLVVLYFVLTSGAFLRGVVLPRVAASLHSDLTVGDVSLSPFSSLTLRKIKLTPTGAETLAVVEEVRLHYSLVAILGGTLKVSEVTVDSPVITVVGHPDGTSNLSHLLDALAQEQKPASSQAPGAPAKLDIHNIVLKNGTLRQTSVGTNGTVTTEVTGLNVTLDQLANGATSKLNLASVLGFTANATNQLAARSDGSFSFDLNPNLQPGRVAGTLDLGVTSAAGTFQDFGKVAVKLTADASPTEVKQLRLALTESGRSVGELNVSGPFDLEKKETRLSYELKGIDRTALGIAGAVAGVDFGETTVSAAGRVDLAQRGQIFASFGKVSIDRLSVSSAAGKTPVLDGALDYKVQVNLAEKTALIEKAELTVQQGGAPIVKGALDRPMNIAWSTATPGFREATYTLSVKQFDLAPWRSVGGTNLPSGRVNLDASVTADRDGRRLKFTTETKLEQVGLVAAGRSIEDLGLTLKLGGSLDDFQVFLLEQVSGEAQHRGKPLAKFSGFVNWNQRSGEAGGQTTMEVQLPAALQMYPLDGVDLQAGVAQFNGQVSIRAGQTNWTVGLGLAGLSGQTFGATLQNYQAQLELAAALTSQQLSVRRGSLALRSGADAGGSLDVTGDFNLQDQRGSFDLRTVNLNEKAIGPFFAAAIAPNELRSVSLDLNGKFEVDLKNESSLKTTLKVTRLVARDPAGKLPEQPLSFGVDLDVSQRAQTLDIRNLAVDLGATDRASNRLRAAGKFDLATNNPAASSLQLNSDGLDLTTLYNMISGDPKSSSPAAVTPPAAPPTGQSGEPIQLPLKEFTLEANIAKLFLRDIAISNLVTKVAIQGGKIAVNPFSLTLNGAPVSARADLDVGVPGYRYDVGADLQSMPIPPLARSMLSGNLVDLRGTVSGKLKLAGAGVEYADLRKNLKGTMEFAATNLDYQISALQTPLMKSLILTLSASLQVPNISQSPLQFFGGQLEVGQGDVNITTAQVSSAAFLAEVKGKIQLADIVTNSPVTLPITVSLPKEGKMEALPQFLTMRGTLGKPKPDINALALAQAATQLPGAAGVLVNRGVSELGGVLDRALGGKDSTNAGAGTSLLQGLLGTGSNTNATPGATNTGLGTSLLKGLLGSGSNTNAVPGATNAAGSTNAPAKPFNPLDIFKKNK